ncbi:MAG TPA: cold-shock protein [Bacilli bacterium]|nr:cold-shock protein [Bacilli bacterium]
MLTGVVKWFDSEKGYGFITMDDGKDIFVHYSVINCDGHKTLLQGQRVSFETTDGNRGLQAKDVTIIA